MWALGVIIGLVAVGALARLYVGRDNVAPMERHFRAIEALRDLSEHPRPPLPDVAPPPDPPTDHVRILEAAPDDARPVRRASTRRPAARSTRTRSKSQRTTKAGVSAAAAIERPTIEIRPPSTPAPALGTGHPPTEPIPEPVADPTLSTRLAATSRRTRDQLAAVPAPVFALAAALVVVVGVVAVAIAGLGNGDSSHLASTPPAGAVQPAASSTTTSTPPTTTPAPVATVVARTNNGATVSVHSPFQLTLHANGTCWVQITDTTGRTLFTATLHSGQEQQIPGAGPITVRLGYTPAVTISVDGIDLDLSGLSQTANLDFQSA